MRTPFLLFLVVFGSAASGEGNAPASAADQKVSPGTLPLLKYEPDGRLSMFPADPSVKYFAVDPESKQLYEYREARWIKAYAPSLAETETQSSDGSEVSRLKGIVKTQESMISLLQEKVKNLEAQLRAVGAPKQ